MGDVVLSMGDLESEPLLLNCRICHSEELESDNNLDAPCSCSGTVKFAHRDCIQRWCNEKGNTTCEICLQEYKHGYTAPPPKKSKLVEEDEDEITLRIEIPRRRRSRIIAEGETESSSVADIGASCCRVLALIITVILLIKHLFAVLTCEAKDYQFAIVTILILKATGILLPMGIVIKIITTIQDAIRQRHQEFDDDTSTYEENDEEDSQQQEHIL